MTRARLFLVALATMLIATAAQAASEEFNLQHTRLNPAAEGKVKIDTQKAGNQKVSIELSHVAQPNEINPSLSNVAVWIVPSQDKTPILQGYVPLDKNKKGKIEFHTPYRSFEVLVTAEPAGTPSQPSGNVLLRGGTPSSMETRQGPTGSYGGGKAQPSQPSGSQKPSGSQGSGSPSQPQQQK